VPVMRHRRTNATNLIVIVGLSFVARMIMLSPVLQL
jgi:hypothetical protein